MSHLGSKALSKVVVDGLLPLADSRIAASQRPFDDPSIFRPHVSSKRWSTVHYGVFVPDLPAPHRYVNTMTLIGAAGAELFDLDHLAAADARNTTTVFSSTANGDQRFFRAYDASADCEFAEDGSMLRWGDELQVEIRWPDVVVRGRYPEFDVDLALKVTDHVSYFVKTPIYDHLSLLALYTGTVDGVAVEGLATFEYARMSTHQLMSSRPMPQLLKLPADFFTYQIIDLDDGTQLLLTDVRARGSVACRLVHMRTVDGLAQVFDDVAFEVVTYGQDQIDEHGSAMRVPSGLRWTVRDGGRERLRIDATVDAPWRSGHGRGYVSAYSYVGQFDGRVIDGSGYIEWIDVQP